MPRKRDLYEILGLRRGASAEEIRAAYRGLARKYHPDVNKAPDAAERFAEVQSAYEVLSNDEQRRAYDRFGHTGRGHSGAGASSGRRAEAPFDESSLSDIFEQFFGGGTPFGGGASPHAPRASRGRDLEHTMSVSFRTAALGGTERIRLAREGAPETIEVKVPSGFQSGGKLRVRGKGGPGAGGGSAGDLIITVEAGEHTLYRREGLDLVIDVPVTLTEAALGASVEIPRLEHGSLTVKVPAGSSSGRRLRVKGQGLEDARGRRGDLFVEVQIVPPAVLTPRARELLGQLAAELKNPRESGGWSP